MESLKMLEIVESLDLFVWNVGHDRTVGSVGDVGKFSKFGKVGWFGHFRSFENVWKV